MIQQQEQTQTKREQDFSIKALLIRKIGQYIDGILINGLSALIFGGFLWVAQRFWGLRLIPFNVLDAVLLALTLMVVSILVLVLIVYLLVRGYLKKHPDVAIGIAFGMLASLVGIYYMGKRKENNEKRIENTFANIFSVNDITKAPVVDTKKNSTPPPASEKM